MSWNMRWLNKFNSLSCFWCLFTSVCDVFLLCLEKNCSWPLSMICNCFHHLICSCFFVVKLLEYHHCNYFLSLRRKSWTQCCQRKRRRRRSWKLRWLNRISSLEQPSSSSSRYLLWVNFKPDSSSGFSHSTSNRSKKWVLKIDIMTSLSMVHTFKSQGRVHSIFMYASVMLLISLIPICVINALLENEFDFGVEQSNVYYSRSLWVCSLFIVRSLRSFTHTDRTLVRLFGKKTFCFFIITHVRTVRGIKQFLHCSWCAGSTKWN